jgi:uncharacterized protein (TIGR02217 family)
MTFHEILFPTDIALGATGGPERKTEIVVLGSGFEERNAIWAHSRRKYDLGFGVRTLDHLHAVIAFFEARCGRLYGFRFRDRGDYKSCAPGATPQPTDQLIGHGDGATTAFALTKTYVSGPSSYTRDIKKPVAGSVRLAKDGTETSAFTVDTTTGLVTFSVAPNVGVAITAGFLFDVPVRFDSDSLAVNLSHFHAGEVPNIPIVELRL